jgi:hypothetical protein
VDSPGSARTVLPRRNLGSIRESKPYVIENTRHLFALQMRLVKLADWIKVISARLGKKVTRSL